ncbi:MAG: hypothetical protein EXX96DRAFT_499271 [Benjaminiella poitrasii]|nr:MAG: hypothetical protein EXX96DRAFT_499271 [Benjaminiella poitrasii]
MMFLAGFGALLLTTGTFVSAATTTTKSSTSTSTGILSVQSPTWLPDFPIPAGVNSGYPTGPLNTSDTLSTETLDLSAYPDPWEEPSTSHAEIKAVIAAIDWDKVPDAPIQKTDSNGDLKLTGYNVDKDPYCWWSDTNCVKPKVSYLPKDISYCPRAGDWGLNYDDGPFNPTGNKKVDKWAEPELYNYLAETNNQKATLFYIGSNVVTYPDAARRALNDGHVLCVHTWSHPQMTTQTNEQVVAQLYWTLRAIKEATGVTTRCWRPPYGDVDDRVRAIAWQMGMRTMIWDEDTNDWDMPGEGGGKLAPSTVDGYFQDWIDARNDGSDNKHGHIVLEHELNNSTVEMTEKWLPKLQEAFNVVSIHECMNISQPYWETNWVYPTEKNPLTNVSTTTTTTTTTTTDSSSETSAASTESSSITKSSTAVRDSAATAALNPGAGTTNIIIPAPKSSVANLLADSEASQSSATNIKAVSAGSLLAVALSIAYLL